MGLSMKGLSKGVSNFVGAPGKIISSAGKGDLKGVLGGVSQILDPTGITTGFIESSNILGKNPFSTQGADTSGLSRYSEQTLNPVADRFTELGNTVITSPTIQAGNVDPAFRNYQLGLAQQLQQQAMGQGPSLAQLQLQQATDRSMNQSLGAIRAATGPNAALAGRTAALAAAQQMGAAGNQSAQLRLQEQQAAQNALAGLTAQGRTADQATQNAQIQAQTANAQQQLAAQQAQAAARQAAAEGLAGARTTQLGTQAQILGYQNDVAMQRSKNSTEIGKAGIGAIASGFSAGLGG